MEANKILATDYIDLLFENRNKKYGSYILRKTSDRRSIMAFLIMLSALIALLLSFYFLRDKNDSNPIMQATKIHSPITVNNIELPIKKNEPIIQKPKQADNRRMASAATQKMTPPIITQNNQVKVEDELKEIDSKKLAGPVNNPGSENGIAIAKTEKDLLLKGNGFDTQKENIIDKHPDNIIYNKLDRIAAYPGGMDALRAFLMRNLSYPQDAIDADIQGIVIIQFVVNEDGTVEQAKVLKGLNSSCNKEALRVVNKMNRWTPGMIGNKNVKSYYKLPISFKLH